MKVNFYKLYTPKPSFKNVEEEKPDFFRDNELFDKEKDKVTRGYRVYNEDDICFYKKPSVPNEYQNAYGVTTKPANKIDTDVIYTEMEDWNKKVIEEQEVIPANYYISRPEEKLLSVSTLYRRGMRPYFDKNLYDYLCEKRIGCGESIRNLVDVCNASKLKRANGSEYFSQDMIDAGLYWVHRFNSNDNHEMKQILKIIREKDDKGNEVFSKEKNENIKNIESKTLADTFLRNLC